MIMLTKKIFIHLLFLIVLSGCATSGKPIEAKERQLLSESTATELFTRWLLCEEYKLNQYQNPYVCSSYEGFLQFLRKTCEDNMSGLGQQSVACKGVDIFERRYKNNPSPAFVGVNDSDFPPKVSASLLWVERINCQRFTSGSGGDPTACGIFEKNMQKYEKACEEYKAGAGGSGQECEALEAYNKEFRNKPDPGPRVPARPPKKGAESMHPIAPSQH